MLSKFMPKKSVASILAVFHTCVSDLRQLAQDKMEEAAIKNARCRDLMREVEAAESEAEAALASADSIENLISSGIPAFESAAEKL